MPTCALIDTTTMRVINTVVASANDPAPDNTILVEVPEGASVDTRWAWDAVSQTFVPGPELKAELDAAALALTADAFEA